MLDHTAGHRADGAAEGKFAPQRFVLFAPWLIGANMVARVAFHEVKGLRDCHCPRQSREKMYMIRHHFELENFYVVFRARDLNRVTTNFRHAVAGESWG